jgi:hypothetical protein
MTMDAKRQVVIAIGKFRYGLIRSFEEVLEKTQKSLLSSHFHTVGKSLEIVARMSGEVAHGRAGSSQD